MIRQLLDLAFELRKESSSERAQSAATAKIQSNFPDATLPEIMDAYAKVDVLISVACQWADEFRGPNNDGQGVPSFTLQERCPGFSDGTYIEAESWGLYLTK